jgi:hypothetical protein
VSLDHLLGPGEISHGAEKPGERLPTTTSGAAVEMNTGDSEAAGPARAGPVLPGGPVHPAATPAITRLSQAHKIRPAAFPRAGCHAL